MHYQIIIYYDNGEFRRVNFSGRVKARKFFNDRAAERPQRVDLYWKDRLLDTWSR